MRIRYTTWGMAVLLLGSGAMGYGARLPRSGDGDSRTATTTKSAPKKPSTAGTHAAVHTTKVSAKRRVAHPTVAREHLQLAPTPARISEIQSALLREGAYQGEANGRWDDETVDAMRHFQTNHGLNPSGKIDALTLQKLGLGSQVSGLGAPVPVSLPQASAADNNEQTQHP